MGTLKETNFWLTTGHLPPEVPQILICGLQLNYDKQGM